MKQLLLLFAAGTMSICSMAQGNGKGNGKDKSWQSEKGKSKKTDDGTVSNEHKDGIGKASKNQPANVREAFQRDYPNAIDVVWGKYKGDWTARFNNGPWRSTAVYHANGDRKDTRTVMSRSKLPGTI